MCFNWTGLFYHFSEGVGGWMASHSSTESGVWCNVKNLFRVDGGSGVLNWDGSLVRDERY